jgi:DNA replication protein DnaC
LSPTGAELLFEVFSRRYQRGSTIDTSNLLRDEWTVVFWSEQLTGALLDRLTNHVHSPVTKVIGPHRVVQVEC